MDDPQPQEQEGRIREILLPKPDDFTPHIKAEQVKGTPKERQIIMAMARLEASNDASWEALVQMNSDVREFERRMLNRKWKRVAAAIVWLVVTVIVSALLNKLSEKILP
jgi:hypothetical protein